MLGLAFSKTPSAGILKLEPEWVRSEEKAKRVAHALNPSTRETEAGKERERKQDPGNRLRRPAQILRCSGEARLQPSGRGVKDVWVCIKLALAGQLWKST